MNFSFDLFGFDFHPSDDIYGFWIFSIKNSDSFHRSLLCIHYDGDVFRIDFAWFNLL